MDYFAVLTYPYDAERPEISRFSRLASNLVIASQLKKTFFSLLEQEMYDT